MTDDNFEIKEPTDYTHKKDEAYSHSQLVMAALKECKDRRAKEMRQGYFNTKFDRMGNAHQVWIPDSRVEFIESVESLKMIQERDYDKEAIDNIKEIQDKLDDLYEELCKSEKEKWDKMNYQEKEKLEKQGNFYIKGLLSENLPFQQLFIRNQVDSYTKIVSEIQKLIKRKGDYQEEMFEA